MAINDLIAYKSIKLEIHMRFQIIVRIVIGYSWKRLYCSLITHYTLYNYMFMSDTVGNINKLGIQCCNLLMIP
jgi:uncharacterized membrane protein